MSGLSRGVAFLAAFGVLASVVTGCSEPVDGRGSLAAEALVPASSATASSATSPAGTASAAPAGTPSDRPTTSPAPRRRDPAAVARAVDIRPGDIPGWRLIPGSRTGPNDSFTWIVVCVRDAGVAPGTLSGAETPDFSPTGRADADQVGTVTGLFPDDAAARRFVALFRGPALGRCAAAEAARTWGSTFASGVPAFGTLGVRVGTAAEAGGIATRARTRAGRTVTFQFIAVRTGPIVTVLSTYWQGVADNRLLGTVATRVGSRQRTA